jgi:hypothetical protein
VAELTCASSSEVATIMNTRADIAAAANHQAEMHDDFTLDLLSLDAPHSNMTTIKF